MPLFFLISGYLYKYITPKEGIKKYFNRLIIPFIFFNLIGIAVFMIVLRSHLNSQIIVSKIYEFLMGMFMATPYVQFSTPNGTVWFLLALFNVILIFRLLKKYAKKEISVFLIILLITSLFYTMKISGVYLYFSLDSAMLGLMFFYVGYLFNKYNLINYFKNNYINIILATVFFTVFFSVYMLTGSLFAFSRAYWGGNFILAYVSAFSGILMIISISSIFSKIKNKLIFLISINTLTIMGIEQFLRNYLYYLFKKLGIFENYFIIEIFILSIIIILASVIIAQLLNKYFPLLIGNRKLNN